MKVINIFFSLSYITFWALSGFGLFITGILMVQTHGSIFSTIVVISVFYITVAVKLYRNPMAYKLEGEIITIFSPINGSTVVELDNIEKVSCYLNVCILKSSLHFRTHHLLLNLNRIPKNDRFIVLNHLTTIIKGNKEGATL